MFDPLISAFLSRWFHVLFPAAVVGLWSIRLWGLRRHGERSVGHVIGYKSFEDDNGHTRWAAIVEWHDAGGCSRTFVEAQARTNQPWPVGSRVRLALAGRDKVITVIEPLR